MLADPTHSLVMFGRAVPDDEPTDAAKARGLASFGALVRAMARSGVADPESSAHHLDATVHGYVMSELLGTGPLDRERLDALALAGLAARVAS